MKNKLLVILLLTLISLQLMALEQDTLKSFYTGELVVLPLDENIYKISNISEIEISNSQASRFLTIDKSLQFNQSVYFQKNSRNEAFIGIRGYDQRQVGIYFDGVPISSQYDGNLDLSIFSLSSLSKISISKNMPSMYYGSNSIGGTINLITNNLYSGNAVNAQIQAGHLTQNYSADFTQSVGKFNLNLDLNYQNNSNYEYPTAQNDYFSNSILNNSNNKIFNSFAKIGFINSDQSIFSLSYLLGRSDKNIPANLLADRKRFWKMPEISRDLVNLTHFNKFSDMLAVRGNLYYEKSYNLLQSYDDISFTTQDTRSAFNSKYDDNKFGGNLITEFNSGILDLTKLSLNYQRDIHKSQANSGEVWKEYETSIMTAAIEQNINFDKIYSLFGASYDLMLPHYADGNDLRPDASSFNYHLGVSYLFSNARIFANLSAKSRFPTQKEFYSEISGVALQNPDLKPERGQNIEIGLNIEATSNLNLASSIFYNQISDLIDVAFLSENRRQYQNIGKALFAGFEANANYKIDKAKFSLAYTYLHSENNSDDATESRLMNRPEHSLTAIIDYNISESLVFNIGGVYYTNHFTMNQNTREIEPLDDYTMLNFSVTKHLGNFSIFLIADNLLNNYNEFEWGIPQPGFNYQFGIRVNI